ncbi:hypothetical protein PMN64_24585 [Bradyrhizobium sp. UFLA01-814]|uniref:hypothetical protein n=1 Tax=Bradyrhizobium sp. UFLA01-814 TaxID=3023480 RepID=UPI00398BA97D
MFHTSDRWHRRARIGWFCSAFFGWTAALYQPALAQDTLDIACIVAADADVAGLSNMQSFPGGEALIRTPERLLVAREVDGKVGISPMNDPVTGHTYFMSEFSGGRALIVADKGLFLAREIGGKLSVPGFSDVEIKAVDTRTVPGGVLIFSQSGLFLAREVGGKPDLVPVGENTAPLMSTASLPSGSILVGYPSLPSLAENRRQRSGKKTARLAKRRAPHSRGPI